MNNLRFKNSCTMCFNCHKACNVCSTNKNEQTSIIINNKKRINKQVSMSSSQSLLSKKGFIVTQYVAQGSRYDICEGPTGGPGDLISSLQKSCNKNCEKTRYGLPHQKIRTAYKHGHGVDKKHGSYSRYLARRVGGTLRKEQHQKWRPENIHQPRNRTGTSVCTNCCNSNNNKTLTTQDIGCTTLKGVSYTARNRHPKDCTDNNYNYNCNGNDSRGKISDTGCCIKGCTR